MSNSCPLHRRLVSYRLVFGPNASPYNSKFITACPSKACCKGPDHLRDPLEDHDSRHHDRPRSHRWCLLFSCLRVKGEYGGICGVGWRGIITRVIYTSFLSILIDDVVFSAVLTLLVAFPLPSTATLAVSLVVSEKMFIGRSRNSRITRADPSQECSQLCGWSLFHCFI